MRGRTARGAVAAAPVLAVALAACGAGGNSSGAPPWRVCGHTLWSAASGAVVTDATGPGPVVVGNLSSGSNVFLQVAPGCARGAQVRVVPADAASSVAVARARDGALAALTLHPKRPTFEVQIRRADGTGSVVRVRVQAGAIRPDQGPGVATGAPKT